jgi:tetratricopeptide (TPR) repeat protein
MLDAGLQRLPNDPQLHLARGVLYVQLGELEKADADFAIAERFDPQQSTSSVARVLTKFQASDPQQARAMIDEELKNHPGDAFLYYLKAEILRSQGARPGSPEFRQALEAGRRAVELQPGLVLARNVLSRLYLEAGDVPRAIDQCRQALREQPLDQVALYRLIRALKMTGKPEDAAEVQNLLKRFSEAREKSVKQEAAENRYQLFVSPGAGPKQTP